MVRRSLPLFLILLLVALPASAQMDVPWERLAQVKLVKESGKFVPEFQEPVQQLSGEEIQLRGFMLPLDQAPRQAHFILSANPVADCFYCMPGGPETLVEVKLGTAVEFSYDPIVISGRLELLKDDPMGMYYRLTEARLQTD
jgi:hypothetical protein